jgi:NADH-quinone oxidoreductase subunit I
VRSDDPVTGRPVPEPEAFFIDIDICMNCGFCAEFCPFDAIKMDHDYELASYDRTTNHIFDKAKLSKEQRYWNYIAPNRASAEADARGGWKHKNFKKSWNTTKADVKQDEDNAADAKAAKREEVRARKAEAEKPKAAAPKADAGDGNAPWNQSDDERERKRQAALERKRKRAAQRAADENS